MLLNDYTHEATVVHFHCCCMKPTVPSVSAFISFIPSFICFVYLPSPLGQSLLLSSVYASPLFCHVSLSLSCFPPIAFRFIVLYVYLQKLSPNSPLLIRSEKHTTELCSTLCERALFCTALLWARYKSTLPGLLLCLRKISEQTLSRNSDKEISPTEAFMQF